MFYEESDLVRKLSVELKEAILTFDRAIESFKSIEEVFQKGQLVEAIKERLKIIQ